MADTTTKSLSVPASYQDVRKIDEFVVGLLHRLGGVDADSIQSVELAVHEVCCNILEHAYADRPGGRIEIKVVLPKRMQPDVRAEVVIELQDSGQPFDRTTVAPIDFESPQEGGYGIFLIDTLMDEVHYERRAGRNLWQLKKSL